MRRWGWVALLVAALVGLSATPSLAGGGHGRVVIGVGPFWGPGYYWGWGGAYYPYWGYPRPYYGYPYYAYPPAVVEEPLQYIEREPAPAPPADWYYCESARAYYPAAPTCAEPWIRVPARQP
jgi:hypothetical protein